MKNDCDTRGDNLLLTGEFHPPEDMTNHFSIVDKINNQIAGKSWDDITEDMQWEVLMFMLHLADISNPGEWPTSPYFMILPAIFIFNSSLYFV